MQALTMLSEDEVMFRDEIAKFAEAHIRPRVEDMDEKEYLDGELISKCFELGLWELKFLLNMEELREAFSCRFLLLKS